MIESQFHIRYDIEDSEIELENLIESLQGFKSSIEIIKDYYNEDADLQVKVKAVDKGSFLLYLGLQVMDNWGYVTSLFNSENVKLTSAIISSLSHSINIKKHLGGKKPKKIEEKKEGIEVKIENKNGNVLIVNTQEFNIFSNSGIDGALTKAFEVVDKEPELKKIELFDEEDTKLVEAPREELLDMTTFEDAELVESSREIVQKNVPVNATKLSWEEKIKWSFIYRGNKITAKITDKNFYEKIDAGQSFAKGDTLRVDLKIKQEFDEAANAFINKGYEIIRVIKHNPRNAQGKLGFE